MPCHGIFLLYLFSMWKILDDVAKYSITWHGIFYHVMCIFVGFNNGLLILSMWFGE
jgi:hypothetical protein